MTCFGMVTTSSSHRYTLPALASFLRNTDLSAQDRVLLIDNDGDFDLPPSLSRIEHIRHDQPRGFAANVNRAIQEAAAAKSDVVFLNNDLIFTAGWLNPLLATDKALLVPACNQNFPYQHGGLSLRPVMRWEDYAGRESDLDHIAALHRQDPRFAGVLWRPLRISFYCFRLPYQLHKEVGFFDEGFGRGGGEDIDYRLRALLAGFDVALALASYVLHFMGKSTWASGEAEAQTRAREAAYIQHFRAKWGDDLTQLFLIGNDVEKHAARLGVERMMAAGDYLDVIKSCRVRQHDMPTPTPGRP